LGNLIDNAVDAAQGTTGARVTVTAYTDEAGTADEAEGPADGLDDPARGPVLVLRVSDTGAGVDPAYRDSVFERGFSTKPSGPGGRGLGLALVRQTARRHGGTLTVAEAPGGGAEFEVRLPLGATEAGEGDPGESMRTPRDATDQSSPERTSRSLQERTSQSPTSHQSHQDPGPRAAAVADAVPGGDDV
ncbi:sensor histidine kinase, partial [Streptomyces neyagawaensis]